ncbi:MAG: ATP-binding domain-containing protein, partial [Acidimicrobiia bacterium]
PVDPKLIGADPAFRAALDALWPSISPPAHVDDLLTRADRLARAADGVLDPEEQSRLLRAAARSRGQVPWTHADLALVDEARHLIEGHTSTYGHVVVDEAQDLSPMELRMIARRAPAGSVTILGDLAQATAAWEHDSWADVIAYLPAPDGAMTRELQLGYRAPGQVLDLAARLLPVAAPNITPTRSVREGKRAPRVIAVALDDLFAAAAREVALLADEGLQVGCIVAPDDLHDVERALALAGLAYGIAERDGLAKRITVLGAPEAKGLEFDAVVVVEPAAIAADAARGLRLLYVALTRPIQHLSIVHARPLPAPLRVTR